MVPLSNLTYIIKGAEFQVFPISHFRETKVWKHEEIFVEQFVLCYISTDDY